MKRIATAIWHRIWSLFAWLECHPRQIISRLSLCRMKFSPSTRIIFGLQYSISKAHPQPNALEVFSFFADILQLPMSIPLISERFVQFHYYMQTSGNCRTTNNNSYSKPLEPFVMVSVSEFFVGFFLTSVFPISCNR